ncbi:hypothetical protein [Streptomyces reniochalinae]|uniref:Uncharacterized protein n=1 Tax=Streptomyces reniochalinae TaxID=2250578 RepID=A0A367EDD5_9ACTN|nr:hypothetical protein [Streptomyces reniochalinae]RCG15250.1 hypothetical protein DQ392_23930 [Streptomyces reniochalinae]
MDLDAVTDELYGLPPDDFTATREQRAQQARQEGARELAGEIHRLRRPTLAAWSANLLAREQPEQARLLLELGEALRQAHRDLDGGRLRELSARQHQATARLAGEAARLADQHGHRISEAVRSEVAGTLHAALADPQAGRDWAAGRLERPLAAPVGFTPGEAGTSIPGGGAGAGGAAAPADARSRRRATKSDRGSSQSDRGRDRGRGQARGQGRDAGPQTGQERARHRKQLARAREQDCEARRALEAREGEHRAAREAAEQAAERQDEAEQRVTALREQLREAEDDHRRARSEARTAQDRLRGAEREEAKARRKADEATARADRLADGS